MSDNIKYATVDPDTVISADKSTTVSKVTVNSLTFNGIEFGASWETDGLKVPMTINNGEGNFPFFLNIYRKATKPSIINSQNTNSIINDITLLITHVLA